MTGELGGGATEPVAEVLTTQDDLTIDESSIVNGSIDIRKTHPNLYWVVMTLAFIGIALGLNFIINSPTFPIYGASNYLWGGIFLVISFAKIIALNFYHLRLVRATMAFSVAYAMFLALGTTQPFLEGTGSLQLPILYAGIAALQIPLLLEPFFNPLTAKKDE